MGQVGIPLFYLQGMGQGMLKFRDLFQDASLYWGWRKYLGLTPATKTGTEALGRYTFNIPDLVDGEWNTSKSEAPRLFVGINSYPCEIITKLETFSNLESSQTGLFISKDSCGFGASLYWAIVQRRYVGGTNNVCVIRDGTVILATGVASSLPMWFRIRVGCSSYRGFNAYFDYSLDGVNWVNLWVENTGIVNLSLNPACVGIYAQNFTAHTACESSFDFFQMKPKSIN